MEEIGCIYKPVGMLATFNKSSFLKHYPIQTDSTHPVMITLKINFVLFLRYALHVSLKIKIHINQITCIVYSNNTAVSLKLQPYDKQNKLNNSKPLQLHDAETNTK